jgi:enamine deaminase RidA (YjgF/YER057c/UK114 family)
MAGTKRDNANESAIDRRLAELGITLPDPSSPAAQYVPYVRTGALVFISGQTPRLAGNVTHSGKVGRDVKLADAAAAARVCGLNLLAHLKIACGGNLDRVVRCVRLTGYVNSDPDFTSQPQVVNGASELMVEVFADRGRHARTAISAVALPSNASVEVEAIFEIDASD